MSFRDQILKDEFIGKYLDPKKLPEDYSIVDCWGDIADFQTQIDSSKWNEWITVEEGDSPWQAVQNMNGYMIGHCGCLKRSSNRIFREFCRAFNVLSYYNADGLRFKDLEALYDKNTDRGKKKKLRDLDNAFAFILGFSDIKGDFKDPDAEVIINFIISWMAGITTGEEDEDYTYYTYFKIIRSILYILDKYSEDGDSKINWDFLAIRRS